MATRSTTKTIGDREYAFSTLPAVASLKVEVTIAKVIGEPLFKAFASRGSDEQTAEQAAIAAVGLLTSRLDEAELVRTMATVFQYVGFVELEGGHAQVARICPNANVDKIDEHFTGRNRELWQVLIEALRFNFADFFSDGLSLSGLIKKAAASSPSNPPTSTG
jgi:hypothetical protein